MARPLKPNRWLTDAELARFLDAVRCRRHKNRPRDHALFALLANTGIRPSEALALRRRDCRLSGAAPSITITRRKKRYGPRPEILVLPRDLADIVVERIAEIGVDADARLFPVLPRQAQRLFLYYAGVAGLRGDCWLYCLRHTAATRLYRQTRSIETVQTLLGHERADTSAIYAHIPSDLLVETVRLRRPII